MSDAPLDGEILDLLDELGATEDDLHAVDGDITDLASIWTLRPGAPECSLLEAAARSGLSVSHIRAVRRAGGLSAIPNETDRAISEREVALFTSLVAGIEVFGENAVLQITRVIGASAQRVADTVTSSFLVNLERHLPDSTPGTVARANIDAVAMLPIVTEALDVFLRHHTINARRSHNGVDITSQYEVRTMTIGFVDIVGSTRLTQSLSLGEMGELLATFEQQSSEIVTENGGRVIKLIGDEVMFAVPEADAAMQMTDELLALPGAIERLPALRVGLATGEVMFREGDLFGPAVNRAARIVSQCAPGRRLVDPATKAAVPRVDGRWHSIGTTRLTGFEEPVELWTVSRNQG